MSVRDSNTFCQKVMNPKCNQIDIPRYFELTSCFRVEIVEIVIRIEDRERILGAVHLRRLKTSCAPSAGNIYRSLSDIYRNAR